MTMLCDDEIDMLQNGNTDQRRLRALEFQWWELNHESAKIRLREASTAIQKQPATGHSTAYNFIPP